MTRVKSRTKRMVAESISIADVARRMGIHRNTALRQVRRGAIPGGIFRWKHEDGRERWTVHRATFIAWFAPSVERAANAANAAK